MKETLPSSPNKKATVTPPVVKDYTNNMGAIDKHDQLKKSYAIDRKSRLWWVRIFLHLLDICRVNSFIMYQQYYQKWNSGPMEEDCRVNSFIMYQQYYQKWNSGPMEEDPPRRLDQKEFSSSLVKSLCGTFTNRRPTG